MSKYQLMFEPLPGGWKYGFPRALPEEAVVKVLGRLIEEAALGARDDLVEALAGPLGALDHGVELGHVGVVVLAVVVLEGLGAHPLAREGVTGER